MDPGHEFMHAVTKEMENHKTNNYRGQVYIHRDWAVVERLDHTLAVHLFRHKYAVEMWLPSHRRFSNGSFSFLL